MLVPLCLATLIDTAPIALDPGRFTFQQGETAALSITEAGSSVSWSTRSLRWLFVRSAGNQTNVDRIEPGPKLPIVLEHAGATLIGMDAPPMVDAAGVRRVRSAAVILLVTSGDGEVPPSATAVSKAGLDVEIRPMMDPTSALVGSDIAFRLYRDGVAQPQTDLIVSHLPDRETQKIRTGPDGFATMRVTRPGVWRVSTEFTRALVDDPDASIELASGSLTFSIPEGSR